jgi:hypothetical protein
VDHGRRPETGVRRRAATQSGYRNLCRKQVLVAVLDGQLCAASPHQHAPADYDQVTGADCATKVGFSQPWRCITPTERRKAGNVLEHGHESAAVQQPQHSRRIAL